MAGEFIRIRRDKLKFSGEEKLLPVDIVTSFVLVVQFSRGLFQGMEEIFWLVSFATEMVKPLSGGSGEKRAFHFRGLTAFGIPTSASLSHTFDLIPSPLFWQFSALCEQNVSLSLD